MTRSRPTFGNAKGRGARHPQIPLDTQDKTILSFERHQAVSQPRWDVPCHVCPKLVPSTLFASLFLPTTPTAMHARARARTTRKSPLFTPAHGPSRFGVPIYAQPTLSVPHSATPHRQSGSRTQQVPHLFVRALVDSICMRSACLLVLIKSFDVTVGLVPVRLQQRGPCNEQQRHRQATHQQGQARFIGG